MAVPFAVRFEACGLAVCDILARSGEHAATSPCSVLAVKIRGLRLPGSGGSSSADPCRRGCGGSGATRPIIVRICDTQQKDPKVMTAALPIGRFPVPDLADIHEDIRNRILAVQ